MDIIRICNSAPSSAGKMIKKLKEVGLIEADIGQIFLFSYLIVCYFSRDGEIGHDNEGLSRVPLSAFQSGSIVLHDSVFFDFTLASFGRGFLNISFTDSYRLFLSSVAK